MEIGARQGETASGPRSPIVRGNRATFRFESWHAESVAFAGDSTGWQQVALERDADGWLLTRLYPEDACDEYLLVVDGTYMLDPLNPLRGPSPFGPHSRCPMPKYHIRPVTLPTEGKMERRELAGRQVDVYVPAAVQDAALLIVQDGYEYAWFTGMPGLLDSLIHEEAIHPTLAAFVSPLDRNAEYHSNDEYVSWLADELVPAVEQIYPVDRRPERRGLVGASLGGLISTYATLQRPEVFHLVGAQSPAYRRRDIGSMLDNATAFDCAGLRIHVDGGTFEETLYGREFLPSIRRGAEALRKKGCAVEYIEVNEGHNWTSWRGRLPELLSWLLGTGNL